MQEVCEFLKQCGTYYVATMDGNQPRVRPFGTAEIFEGKLYIQTGKVKNVYRQMKENPLIEISGMTGGRWIRLQATAVEDDRIEARQHMLDAYPSLEKMYRADDGNTVVFSLENATATICSFTDEPKVICF